MRARRWLSATTCALVFVSGANANPSATPDRPNRGMDLRALAIFDREQAPYIARARSTFPAARARFLAGLPSGHEFYVTTRLSDSAGHLEQVFVLVSRVSQGRIEGRLATAPELLTDIRRGDPVSLAEGALRDWTITDAEGREEGNVAGNFVDRYAPTEERCGVLAPDAQGKLAAQPIAGWQVSTEDAATPLALPAAARPGVKAVQCVRRSIIPFLSDTRVLAAGFPLSLMETGGDRVSVLEVVQGHLRLQMIRGEMTDAETEAAQVYLDAAQKAMAAGEH